MPSAVCCVLRGFRGARGVRLGVAQLRVEAPLVPLEFRYPATQGRDLVLGLAQLDGLVPVGGLRGVAALGDLRQLAPEFVDGLVGFAQSRLALGLDLRDDGGGIGGGIVPAPRRGRPSGVVARGAQVVVLLLEGG